MKKTTSIWMLCARNTVYKLLGLLALMAAAETGMFVWRAGAAAETLGNIFWMSHISLIFFVVLVLWTLVLTVPGQARSAYTMQRLQTEKKALFVTYVCYNAVTYLILWGTQVAVLLALFSWYGHRASPEIFGPQTIALAFYRDWFLHSLLPLGDWFRYLRNICIVLALACAAAAVPLRTRKTEKRYRTLVVLLVIVCFFFSAGAGMRFMDAALSVVTLLVGGMSLYFVWDEDVEESGHENS